MKKQIVLFLTLISLNVFAFPAAPVDPAHPGSKIYSYGIVSKKITCSGRAISIFIPTSQDPAEKFPVVVYGHGQALGLDAYQGTLEHLAKKGVISIFPAYDNGFFDQEWTRMGRDYVNLTACALQNLGAIVKADRIVFSGHSKGAYIASIAAGIAVKESLAIRPNAMVLFEAAGADADSLRFIEATTALTVVFSDKDTVVERKFSETIYSGAKSTVKQFIFLKSYGAGTSGPYLNADHFWPLTKKSLVGGGPESAFHYFGEWKWLAAAALNLNSYIYGADALDKGVPGFQDEVRRNF